MLTLISAWILLLSLFRDLALFELKCSGIFQLNNSLNDHILSFSPSNTSSLRILSHSTKIYFAVVKVINSLFLSKNIAILCSYFAYIFSSSICWSSISLYWCAAVILCSSVSSLWLNSKLSISKSSSCSSLNTYNKEW